MDALTILRAAADLIFVTSVQLVALSSIVLTSHYGPIYVRGALEQGWGACDNGFIRFARDMAIRDLVLAAIFAAWGLRLWYDNVPPMEERFLGPLTMIAIPVLLVLKIDLVKYAIRGVYWAWTTYLFLLGCIVAANVVRLLG